MMEKLPPDDTGVDTVTLPPAAIRSLTSEPNDVRVRVAEAQTAAATSATRVPKLVRVRVPEAQTDVAIAVFPLDDSVLPPISFQTVG